MSQCQNNFNIWERRFQAFPQETISVYSYKMCNDYKETIQDQIANLSDRHPPPLKSPIFTLIG